MLTQQLLTTVLLIWFVSQITYAQNDTIPTDVIKPIEQNQDLIEDYIQGLESDSDFDFNTVFEGLEYFLKRPLNLNKVTREELLDLMLLDEIQITNLINYRKKAGDLISLHELQAIPGFDLDKIKQILPYVTTGGDIDDFNVSIPTMLYKGKNELFLRYRTTLEKEKGEIPLEEGQEAQRFLGDPHKLYFRYRHTYDNKLSYGITAEKDEGEEFFKGSNKQGFDFYSFHIGLKNYNKLLKDIVIGDFAASFGQGLIMFSGFGGRKGNEVINIKRSERTLRPYTSVNEASFLRGAGATLALSDNLDVSLFASYRAVDANIVDIDTLEQEEDIENLFSSFQLDGFHRTPNEIADEASLKQTTLGAQIKYYRDNWHIALNGIYDQFDLPIFRNPAVYNQFFFIGDKINNVSLDYSYIYRNLHFFGETARSSNFGSIASVNGLLIGLDRKVDMAILYRHLPADYQAMRPRVFAETSQGANEYGLYLGLDVQPNKHWRFVSYFDMFRHPWLRYNADAPSQGYDVRSRLTYKIKRKLTMYLQAKYETKTVNARDPEGVADADLPKLDYLVPEKLLNVRFHVDNKLSKALSLRTRFDAGFYQNGDLERQTGFGIYQDVVFKPISLPFSLSARYAIFDTDGYAVRFYSYENDLINSFSVPAYYNQGMRYYLNFRYTGIRNLSLEFRIARLRFLDQDTIGGGLNEIDAPHRTEIKAQVKYTFSNY